MVLIPRCALFKISQLKICADAFGETGVTRSNAVAILQTDKNHCSMLKQAREIFALNIKNYFFVESWPGSRHIYLADPFFTQDA